MGMDVDYLSVFGMGYMNEVVGIVAKLVAIPSVPKALAKVGPTTPSLSCAATTLLAVSRKETREYI